MTTRTDRTEATSVFAADPQKNTIFSIHMYGVFDTAARAARSVAADRTATRDTAASSAMAEAMVALEHTHDHLLGISKNDWQPSAKHPDLSPPHEALLLRQIEQYSEELKVEEVGEVLEVKDGVARIYGLTNAMASEMLEITSSETGDAVTALALNLEEDNIGAVVMGDWTSLHEGDTVRRTGRVLDLPVGAAYLGRVVELAV